jgi:small conductance mechanosensitive channel
VAILVTTVVARCWLLASATPGLPPAAAGNAAVGAERVRQGIREAPGRLQGVLEQVVDGFFRHLPGVVVGLLVFLLFYGMSRLTVRVVRRVADRAHTDPALRDLLSPLVRMALMAIGVVMALDQMGFEVRSLLAGLGIVGLAVGLAAQETIASVFAGFLILWDRPFRIGDTVKIAGHLGEVTAIGLRSTRIRTLDQREVILPNKDVIQQAIVNHSRYDVLRISAALAIAYGVDVGRARAALLGAVRRDFPGLAEPAADVVITALNESGVALELRVWVAAPPGAESSQFALLEVAKRALDDAGIEIPIPRRDVRLLGEPEAAVVP